MNFLRRALPVLLLIAGGVGFAQAESVDKLPKPTDYLSDFAGVIDPASKAQIEELCGEVDRQAHAQIAVVTIKSLDGQTIEDFTTALEDKWKVGAKGTDKGIVMVFAIQDHKRRIEVGYGLEGILNDAKVGDIGRSMVPQLDQGQYGPAIEGGVVKIANVIAADAGVSLTTPEQRPVYHSQTVHRRSWIGPVVFLIIFLVLVSRGGGGRGGGGWMWFLLGNILGGGFGGGRGGGDGGGFGGGGGGGDGGGFGGFGGGSSGGGGASGDW